MHAGDAYFHHKEVRRVHPRCPPGLVAYQNLMEVDRDARLANQERLRALSLEHRRDLRMICAHDVLEYQACAAGRAM